MIDTSPMTAPGPDEGAALLASLGGAAAPQALGALLALLDRGDLGLGVRDAASGRYVYVNARLAGWLGVPAERLLAGAEVETPESGQVAALRSADQTAVVTGTVAATEHKIDIAGTRREFNVVRCALPGAGGAAPRLVVALWSDLTTTRQRDAQLQKALGQIEQQQQATEALRRETQDQGLRDGVSGLYHRAHFEDQLRREVDLSSREHREFSLVSIALDPLSDEARAAGPDALARIHEAIGRLLRGGTRAMDASCRLGDRHFAVLLSGVGLATAHSRMEGLRRQCATQIVVLGGRDLGFTVSMGVASFPHTAHTQQALVDAADAALAEASKRGGNRVALASIRFEPAA